MKYRIVSITNNPAEYPESAADSSEFPHLVQHVQDEQELFVVADAGQYWRAEEFFLQVPVRAFTVET